MENNKNKLAHIKSDEIKVRTQNHEVEIKGDVAKGIAVAASAVLGFAIGFLLARKF
jgi:osmotically-inducible protein OsmY